MAEKKPIGAKNAQILTNCAETGELKLATVEAVLASHSVDPATHPELLVYGFKGTITAKRVVQLTALGSTKGVLCAGAVPAPEACTLDTAGCYLEHPLAKDALLHAVPVLHFKADVSAGPPAKFNLSPTPGDIIFRLVLKKSLSLEPETFVLLA
jgi:hypothetical protein